MPEQTLRQFDPREQVFRRRKTDAYQTVRHRGLGGLRWSIRRGGRVGRRRGDDQFWLTIVAWAFKVPRFS
ncbi:MAG: hypothetical protein A2X36_11330 [Elusimicrobia bacterium GWA2_69_24]|nr:MAG: hypothetical protein A2X36_11330 [Elusimicrobia bacterium GWA2_69_24]